MGILPAFFFAADCAECVYLDVGGVWLDEDSAASSDRGYCLDRFDKELRRKGGKEGEAGRKNHKEAQEGGLRHSRRGSLALVVSTDLPWGTCLRRTLPPTRRSVPASQALLANELASLRAALLRTHH